MIQNMPTKTLAKNRRAFHEYLIIEKMEAGIVLAGTEVKSIRAGKLVIKDAWVDVTENLEAYLMQLHVSAYDHGNIFNHATDQPRKLLLHKKQLKSWRDQLKQKSITAIPLGRVQHVDTRQGPLAAHGPSDCICGPPASAVAAHGVPAAGVGWHRRRCAKCRSVCREPRRGTSDAPHTREGGRVDVRVQGQEIMVTGDVDRVTLWIDSRVVDTEVPFQVTAAGRTLDVVATVRPDDFAESLLRRGDPTQAFPFRMDVALRKAR